MKNSMKLEANERERVFNKLFNKWKNEAIELYGNDSYKVNEFVDKKIIGFKHNNPEIGA